MNMTDRDKKALTFGAVGVGLILFAGYVLSPMLRNWSESRNAIQDRHAKVTRLQEKLAAQDTLRTRRDVLALRIGSLRLLQPPKVTSEKPEEIAKPEQSEKAEASSPKSDKVEEKNKEVPEDAADGDEKVDAVAKDGDKESKVSPGAPVEPAPPAEEDSGAQVASDDEAAEVSDDNPPLPSTEIAVEEAVESGSEEKKDESAPPENAQAKDKGDTKKSEKAEQPSRPTIAASSLATYFEKNAKAAKVKIKRIAPKKNATGKKKTEHFVPVTIQVSFECKVNNLVTLLHSLEKGELFTRVDQMEIDRDLSKGDLLTASLSISSYEPVRSAP